jgi:restriction system protein
LAQIRPVLISILFMPIPDYQTVMLPFLTLLSGGKVYSLREITKQLAATFELTEDELGERIPSGQSTVFDNRVGWARTYLKKAALVETVARGQFRITPRGLDVLKAKPAKIDHSVLNQFAEFQEFRNRKTDGQDTKTESSQVLEQKTPHEILDAAYQQLRRELADEILQTVRAASPAFFEHLVVDVLVAMGYGGSVKDAGQLSARPVMMALTESSKRIASVWTKCIFRRRDGAPSWAVLTFNLSQGVWRDDGLARASSSQLRNLAKKPSNT